MVEIQFIINFLRQKKNNFLIQGLQVTIKCISKDLKK